MTDSDAHIAPPSDPDEATQTADPSALAEHIVADDLGPDAVRSLLGGLPNDSIALVVSAVASEVHAREVLVWLPREQAGPILAALEPARAASLLVGMPSDERADLLAAVDRGPRDVIQSHLPAEARSDAARLLNYEPDSAGGLMETEFVAYPERWTVREAIRDLRANQQRYAAIGVQYVYLLDSGSRLTGVAPIRDLMLSPEDRPLSSLVTRRPATVLDTASLHSVAEAFDEFPFLALPVVDAHGVMLGVVSRADAVEGEQEEAEDDYRVSQGIVGGEELRSMPVLTRMRRRGAWLGVNLVLCLGGAGVIALFQDTLAKAIVIAAVLPVVSATSGNAAMQAAAVTIRELTLGVIAPSAWRRVLIHELALAAGLAIPLGGAVAVLATLWGASGAVGAAAGGAMALNAGVAVGIGAVCPLLLRRFGVDPALASGPISTTLADMTGFALTLGLVALAT